MSDFNRGAWRTGPVAGTGDMAVDVGLRSFMLGVYNKLALGLVLSGVLAYLTSGPLQPLFFAVSPTGRIGYTALGTIVAFAPLALILVSSFVMRNPSPRSSGMLYWGIVSLIGASLGVLVLAYTGVSIATTLLITATAFGGLSLVGYTTKRDLTAMGSFLIMGMWGIMGALLVNLFLHSPAIAFVVSILGVLIFSGLIAYDTQRLKMTYYELGGNQAALGVATNYGALSLYLDFINLFQFLLSLFGARR